MATKTFEQLLQTYENALDYYHVKQLRYNMGQYDVAKLVKLADTVFEERKELKIQLTLLVQRACKEAVPEKNISLDTITKYIG
jgi:hypothetical protein